MDLVRNDVEGNIENLLLCMKFSSIVVIGWEMIESSSSSSW
jgi:hypothetical protein